MHRCACVLLMICVFPAMAAVPGPERALTAPGTFDSTRNPQAHAVAIADLFFTRRIAESTWSPDGKEVVLSTNLTGRYNLWKVPASGGWPIQLTRSEDRQRAPAWSPDGRWIVFAADRAGNESFDLYAVPANGGEVVDLTKTDAISERGAQWSPNGQALAFQHQPSEAPAIDIAVMDWDTRKVRLLTHEATRDHTWSPVAWSRDGHFFYANRYNASATDVSAWRIDVVSGKLEELTPHKGVALFAASDISMDGNWLALTSNVQSGHDEVALYDIARKKYRWVTHGIWDAQSGEFSPDGGSLTYSVNTDGRGEIHVFRIAEGRSEKYDLPDGTNAFVSGGRSFSSDGKRLLVSHQSSTTPADLHILDIERGTRTQLTQSALASLDSPNLPAAQLVHYASFDGTVVSAFMWLPFNLKRDGSAPAVVLVHGGPNYQSFDVFDRTAIALASRGYVCIAPNVRGSTGYGKAFEKANHQDVGGGDLQDEVFAGKFLVATGYVDAKKIGITGGSYGGFMALMAAGRTPDLWAAAVDLFGVTDWLTEQQHESPALQQYDQSLLGDPVKDKKIYEAASPTTYFHAIKAPVLVLQGENDARDPKEEAERAFDALRKAGKIVDAHYYPGEGHGFAKRENQIDALERTVAWFDRYLKGATP
jgi:dipeptidyl aminopeptidase/acylaminoacyl peptidase